MLVAGDAVRRDLESGLVDSRVVGLLDELTARHVVEVSVVKTGHPLGPYSPAGRENDHYFYRAVDIVAVDGVSVADDPVASALVAVGRLLMSRSGEARPARVMGPAAWLSALGPGDRSGFRDDEFATRIHHDHLHVGF